MEKVIVILSGGLDSTTLLYDILNENKYEVHAMSFNYGQNHSKEIDLAKQTCEKLNVEHKIIDISFLGKELFYNSTLVQGAEEIPEGHYQEDNMKSTVVPMRNLILISLVGAYASTIGATKIYYGAHAGDHEIYPDCRKEFIESLKETLKLADWSEISLEAPYSDISKIDIVKKGLELNVDYSLTWTCYKGNDKACGKCGSCVERVEAFEENNSKDEIEYEN